jgi:hypothetical protein
MANQGHKKPYPLRGPSLANSHPQHAAMADGWDPSLYSANSNLIKDWKCKKGHKFQSKIYNFCRPKEEELCHVCSGRKVLAGYNDLKTLFPQIAQEADGWDPSEFTSGSNSRKPWKCKLGHTWEVKINSRVAFNTKCPQCSHQKVTSGVTDLRTKYPLVAKQAHGWDPAEVMPGSHIKKDWICEKGHIWKAPVNIRVKGSGCPFCSGYFAIPGETDLKTRFPRVAAQADGWDPATISPNSNKRLSWKCELGHQWKSIVMSRTQKETESATCPVCTGQKVLIGFNDLLTIRPDLASEANGWDPKTYTAGSGKKVSWKCAEGHVWIAQIASRTSGNGCPECALFGFKPERDAWLYLLQDEKRGIMKIGITNDFQERVGLHKRRGFVVVDSFGPKLGKQIRDWEQQVISQLRTRGIKFADTSELGTFDGYTEAWYLESLKVESLKSLFNLLDLKPPLRE